MSAMNRLWKNAVENAGKQGRPALLTFLRSDEVLPDLEQHGVQSSGFAMDRYGVVTIIADLVGFVRR